ncbi:hypothetical protein [Flavobacterium fluviatile]|uniref:hypothetical protein n=1 Tax=Flavobacterium fluviatile TaxID=1862387 RepID=UPI0013D80CF7|nr:hypothetical protein [Flavobacterium fluviatile]
MEKWTCNSFYEKDEPTASVQPKSITTFNTGTNEVILTPVLSNNLTHKGNLSLEETPVLTTIPATAETVSEPEPETKTAVKKKSTLWIWGAAYLASILYAPSENPNYIDKSNTNVTP